jgi:hypothetical protein
MGRAQEENESAVRALEEKHVKALEENRNRLEQSLPTIPKASSELLNLKKI